MRYSRRVLSRINKHSPSLFHASAFERNQLFYVPRFMCQASLPKRLENTGEWNRKFRDREYSIISPSAIGVPGGPYSRLILIYITTIARLTKSPEIELGNSFSEVMKLLGLQPTGGSRGTVDRFKEHFLRCINCVIHTQSTNGPKTEISILPIIESALITDLNDWQWYSHIKLSSAFFDESQESVPTDLGALKCLMPGTLKMDLFNFLIWRLYYLKLETTIPWKELYLMFSSPGLTNKRFRQSFKQALLEAKSFYPSANVEINNLGLVLRKSELLIPRKR